MKTTKMKLGVLLLATIFAVVITSCKKKGCTDETAINYNAEAEKDDGSCTYEDETNTDPSEESIVLSGDITSSTTLTSDKCYELAGRVVVQSGVTLTIEAGTVIKGQEGTGTLASALVIARGGSIMAEGTADNPIVFTSVLDNIACGGFQGTNLDETDQGLWGGVLILGNAPISAADGDDVSQIEGIPAGETYGAFGGTDVADNSGVFKFVSIRHGGATIGAGNEINGLTLGGVGTGTVVSDIEVIGNLDDGVECFGGTVDISNVLVAFQGDDAIDVDMNYAGTVDNFITINGANSDEALEIDGPEGTTHTSGMFTLSNGTCYEYGSGVATNGDFKSNAQGTISNVKFGSAKIRASYQNNCADAKEDAFTHLTTDGTLVFTGSEFTSVSVYTGSTDDAGTTECTVTTTDQTAAEAAAVSTVATGATATFTWSWAAINGKM